MKHQKKAIGAILDQLTDGAQTVPAIAAATGAPTAETLWYMAALKKYGQIKEAEKDGGYFKYERVNG
jgi:DNA-binding IclR family transcriptional regulator